MRTSIKLGLTALAAAALLSSLVATASAGRFSVSSRLFRIVWSSLVFEPKPSDPNQIGQITCEVTMEGSFHANTITKTLGTLIGYVTRAKVAHPCSGNRAEYWFHNATEEILETSPGSLPWHVRYRTFTGFLPTPTGVEIQIAGIQLTAEYRGLTSCLASYGSSGEEEGRTMLTLGRGGQVERAEPTTGFLIRRQGSRLECPFLTRMRGTSNEITPWERVSRLSITLI
jgi:hypothetical protein